MMRCPEIPTDPRHVRILDRCRSACLSALCTLALASAALADDTEVFFGQVDRDTEIYPNVLFVLDTSGSMNGTDSGHSGTRLERMKEALNDILDSTANVNIGMMRFNGWDGGGAVIFPLTGIDEPYCDSGDCSRVNLVYRVDDDDNDSEEKLSNGEMTLGGNTLSLGETGGGTEQLTAVRFDGVEIPQGATVTSAVLEFTANGSSSGSADLDIRIEDEDDASVYNSGDNELSNRDRHAASVSWTPGNWSNNGVYQSPDIATLVQTVVNRSGWCGGQAMSFIIDGSGNRDARSHDNSASKAPALKLTYDVESIPESGGCLETNTVVQVGASSDDAEENLPGNEMDVDSGDLDMPRSSSYTKRIGIRFPEVPIPANATIQSASIEFETEDEKTGSVSVRIHGQAADDPDDFDEDDGDITSRIFTSASVDWNDLPETEDEEKVETPDVKSIVEELIGRSGWQQGNAMVFLFDLKSGSGRREYETYDSKPESAAKLKVAYSLPSGSGSMTVSTLTARDRMKQVVNGISATGGTPIVSALYEASLYYRGKPIDYGRTRGSIDDRHRYHRVSVPNSYTGGSVYRASGCTDADMDDSDCVTEAINGSPVYNAPLASSCQSSHVVILSDGSATSNTAATRIKTLTGAESCENTDSDEACGTELAEWLGSTDHNLSLSGKQNITTHSIGFNFSGDFLPELAAAGGGSYYNAESAEELASVFQSILGDVLAVDTSFVAPGATVNQFNRLTHRNDIYFALFKPSERPRWSGNLKRYEVGASANGGMQIKDVNGNNAIDASTGFFADGAQSWWSDTVDGNQVALGGAAAEMQLSGPTGTGSRRVFTYTGDPLSLPSGGVNLTASEHALNESNNDITDEMLGLSAYSGTSAERAAYREQLLKWARGVDVLDADEDGATDDVRSHIGDPMHSRPVILNYAGGYTSIYIATNEGFLHAVDRAEGKELYAVIPQELLGNLDTFFENSTSARHPYGLDGALTVRSDDPNNNVTIDSGEKAYLYAGMRRGGSNYYAFDVSSRTAPKLQWIIRGGPDGTPGFEELGESWSRAVPTKIMFKGAERDVLIFGAGYDVNQDDDPANLGATRTTDSIGRGIFVVDANTGERIWAALGVSGGDQQFSDMHYSIPSDIRAIDVDFDGFTDQLYVGDMGGQLWRFDVVPYHQSGDLLDGGVMANISGTGLANERRFYYEPDVALIGKDGQRFLSISIGSGWRAHPLDNVVEDRFYMIKSTAIYGKPEGYGKPVSAGSSSYTPITEADLLNVTDDLDPGSNDYGWFLELEQAGEKVLSDSITVNNQIVFSSYRPELDLEECSTAVGGGAVYVVNVLDGSPSLDHDGDGVNEKSDRDKELTHGGIPPAPTALITEDGPTILVGPEQPVDPDFNNLTRRSFWIDHGAGNMSEPVATGEDQ